MSKLDELVLYISNRYADNEHFGKTALHKLLWMSDFHHYATFGESITNCAYLHRQYGPMCRDLERRLRTLIDGGKLVIRPVDRFGHEQLRPVALERPDLSEFTAEEIFTVESILWEMRDMTARQLSALSHEHPGWRGTDEGEQIPYHSALLDMEQPTLEEAEALGRGQWRKSA